MVHGRSAGLVRSMQILPGHLPAGSTEQVSASPQSLSDLQRFGCGVGLALQTPRVEGFLHKEPSSSSTEVEGCLHKAPSFSSTEDDLSM
jgi:hypothetical protein